MSIMNQHEMMQNAFVEAKDIMNQIFTVMGAPNDWQIRHMTFDELVAGLYKILGLWEGEYRDDVNITEDAILEGYTAYNKQLKKIIGKIPKLAEQIYTPGVNDQIITRGVYLDGDQKILGDSALIPENIKKGATIFGVQGSYQPEDIHVDPVDPTDPTEPSTEVEKETAESIDVLKGKFAYRNNLTKILGDLLSRMDQISEGDPKRVDDTNLYVSPVGRRAVYNKNSELGVPLDDIGKLLNIDPSKIEKGYKILGIEGTHKCKEINKDTDGDGEPDINIPVSEDNAPWVDPEKVKPEDKNKPVYINDDTDGDDKPDINIDTDGDGKPDLNIDTDKDNEPDVNIDTDGDGEPDLNIDTDGDYKPDINIDTDGDGKPDINIDKDGDGEADTNIDTDGDGQPDVNIEDDELEVNKDTDGDGIPDINIDTDNNGDPDLNIDTNDDDKPDVNIDTNNDNKPDLNVDTDGDGKPDVNIDTDGDGKADTNIDADGDGKPDKDKDNVNDKKRIRPRDPDDHDKEENAKDKDDRMENPYGDNDPVIDDLRDDIKQDPIDKNNTDEEDNPIFDEEHNGDEPKDEEHHDLIEVEDEEGKKHYVPNPALQWAYSDYYLPMIYPTTQIHNPEKYANPIELSRTVQQTYNVINDFFIFGANLSNSHARTYPHDGEYILWYDNNGNITEQYTHEQTIEYFSNYELAQIKNKLDQEIIQSSANGNNVWIGGVSGLYQNWADDPGSGSCIYMDGEGKWHRSNGSEEFNAVYEKKNTRVDRIVTETLPAGQKTAIDSNEINAAMIPFVRYAIVQETRGKMYHYGNDTYLNLTALSKNLDAELPGIKSIAGSASAVPPNDVYDGYMTQWPNSQGMPPTIMEYQSDAYNQDNDGNAIEKPDYEYFQHNNYIEDALKCYKRFGKFFEKNGEMNSCSYKDVNGQSFTEAPTVTIDGESLLQIYVGDLKLTPSEVSTIWYVAFQDYNDYLPAFNGASCTTIDIQDTVYSYETTTVTETHTKPMDEISIVDAEYSASGKEILRFSPGQTVEHTNLTVTMNTRHWNSFTLYEHDESDNKTQVGTISVSHNHIDGPEGGEFDPFSMTLNDVTLEANKTYSIVTSECSYGGTEKGKFVYSFNITDSANRPVQLQVEYETHKQVRTKVPHQITRTIAEHAYCEFYPEDFRQECFQDIEDTFQEIAQYVQENVGVKYKEHFVGNIFDRGSEYTSEEKKKIAKCIHDYLVVNNSYAYGDDMNQTLYPAMSRGKRHPVCASYSQAFKYCCSRYGIVCHIVMGICNPGGDLSDPYGGRHEWNRINYSSYSLQESQYLHNNGKIVSSEVSTPEVISKLIDTYDAENRKYYTDDNSGRTDKLFFKDPSFSGNKIDVAYIRSHNQYDKANWSDVDVTWDDPSEPGTDVIGNTDNISWSYFNVDSNYMKQDFSGSRIYTKQFITNMGNQGYANLVGQDSHQDQYPSGKTDKYYGSELYKW